MNHFTTHAPSMDRWRLLFNVIWAIFIMAKTRYIWWDNDVRFVLGHHVGLDLYGVIALKQQFSGIHVAPLGHIILIPSKHVFALTAECCMEKQKIPIL